MKGEYNLKDPGGDGSTMLNWILTKFLWTELIWLRTELVNAFYFKMGINFMTVCVTVNFSTKFCYVELVM